MMKRGKISAILLIAVLYCSGIARAQDLRPRAVLDSSNILIGDQVKLHVEITYPANMHVTFPVPGKTLSEFIEIVDRSPVDTSKNANGAMVLSQDYIITSFDSGQHVIPSFWFKVSNSSWNDSVPSNQPQLNVYTIPKLDSLIRVMKGPIDVKKPYEAPLTLKEVAPLILGVILFLGLIFLVLYALARRKNNRPLFSAPPKPKEPAHIIALRELNRIKEEKIWQQGKTKLYYSELSDTIRAYISDRYEIPAMEQTTEEIIAAFKYRRSLLNEKLYDNLIKMLRNADLVKFAKYEPMPDENNLAIVDAFFFVNQTKIEIKKEPEAPTGDKEEGEDVVLK